MTVQEATERLEWLAKQTHNFSFKEAIKAEESVVGVGTKLVVIACTETGQKSFQYLMKDQESGNPHICIGDCRLDIGNEIEISSVKTVRVRIPRRPFRQVLKEIWQESRQKANQRMKERLMPHVRTLVHRPGFLSGAP